MVGWTDGDLSVETELFKTEGSANQELQPVPLRDRPMERATRYLVGNYRDKKCFVKQYPDDPLRAEREFQLCCVRECRNIVRSIARLGDMVIFEYVEGIKLSRLRSVTNTERFRLEFARALHEICNTLKVAAVYDFHTNNVLVRPDGGVTFIDFDLKTFGNQRERIRRFLGESLQKAGIGSWRRWRIQRQPIEMVARKMLKIYGGTLV
jgi:hypothetical protein